MGPTRRLLPLVLAGALPGPAALPSEAPSVAGHFVVLGLARLGGEVAALFDGLGFGPSLLTPARIRERVALDLGLASSEGLDPHAPLGAVWVEDAGALVRVPFCASPDPARVGRAAGSAVHVEPFGARGLVLAPDAAVGRAVASYLERSPFAVAAAGPVVAFRFAAEPFVCRGAAWLGLRAEMLRGVDRVASLLGAGRPDLRRLARTLEDLRGCLAPWELVDGEVSLGARGIAARGRLAVREESGAARWLRDATPLRAAAPETLSGVVLRVEWSGGGDAVARWVDRLREATPVGWVVEETERGGRVSVPRDGCVLAARPGDAAGPLVRVSVACEALRGGGTGGVGVPLHLHATAEEDGLRVVLSAPIAQLRACVPRIERRR